MLLFVLCSDAQRGGDALRGARRGMSSFREVSFDAGLPTAIWELLGNDASYVWTFACIDQHRNELRRMGDSEAAVMNVARLPRDGARASS
jgi:hypothetical protein